MMLTVAGCYNFLMGRERNTPSIGIGITTFNRPDVLERCLEKMRKHLPPNAVVVVVDDGSTVAPRIPKWVDFTITHTENKGIAASKNACLMALEDCDHIFLFDDDTWPTADEWWRPYVESPEPHLMYLFTEWGNGVPVGDAEWFYDDGTLRAATHPRGCMMYIDTRVVLPRVGGMDYRFLKWGSEHVDWSCRIHSAGLTSFRYQDVSNSGDFIYSADEHLHHTHTHPTTVPVDERKKYLPQNRLLKNSQMESGDYRNPYGPVNLFLTSFFVGVTDIQRGTEYDRSPEPLRTLVESARQFGEVVVLHNGIDVPDWEGVRLVEVSLGSDNPYRERWTQQHRWLLQNRSQGFVWCLDATDTEILRDPFQLMQYNLLYVGSERLFVDNPWMRKNFPTLTDLFSKHAQKQLLNCGIVGGDWDTVTRLNRRMVDVHSENPDIKLNMGPFNLILHGGEFQYITNEPIHTEFKKMQTTHPTAWIRHK